MVVLEASLPFTLLTVTNRLFSDQRLSWIVPKPEPVMANFELKLC